MSAVATPNTNPPSQPQLPTKGQISASKDYVEHLRSVHFVLIGTSIILAFLAFSPSPSQYEEAKEQIIAIQRLDRATLEMTLEREYETALKSWNHSSSATLLATDATVMRVPELGQTFKITFKPPNEGFVRFFNEVLGFDPSDSFDEGFPDPHSFHSLAEFRKLWDSLYAHRLLAVPTEAPTRLFTSRITNDGNGHLRLDPEIEFKPLSASFSKEPNTKELVEFQLAPCPASLKKAVLDLSHANCRYIYLSVWGEKNLWLALPVEERGSSLEINPQKLFLRQDRRWVSGTFDSSFDVLNQLSTNIQDLRLDSLRRVLETEASQKGDSFEAVGIKFPSETTKWAGFVVLCGIQLYLFLLLYEEPSLSLEGVPWMGLYKSKLAKAMTFITIVLLPTFALTAILFTKWNVHYTVWQTAGLSTCALFLLALSILTWIGLRRTTTRR